MVFIFAYGSVGEYRFLLMRTPPLLGGAGVLMPFVSGLWDCCLIFYDVQGQLAGPFFDVSFQRQHAPICVTDTTICPQMEHYDKNGGLKNRPPFGITR